MTLLEKVNELAERVKLSKQDQVAAPGETTDLPIMLYFWRDDELAVSVLCPLDRDTGLAAGRLGSVGFSASTLAMIFESYYTQLERSPLTGEPWIHQELQFVCETMPEAQEKGWVSPALTLSAHERDGDFLLRSMPYQIKEELVLWDEVSDHSIERGSQEVPAGTMFDYLQQTMQQPPMSEQVLASEEARMLVATLSPEIAATHSDLATMRTLVDKKLATSVVFYAKPDTDRAELLTERLGSEHVYTP